MHEEQTVMEKFFFTVRATGRYEENCSFIKDIPKLQKLVNLTETFFQ